MNRLAQALDRWAIWWMKRRFWPPSKNGKVSGDVAAVVALSTHPGFIALSAQLEVYKARLESKLRMSRSKPPTSLDEVIAAAVSDARDSEAIFRIGWLRHIVLNEIFKDKASATRQTPAQFPEAPTPRS